MSTSIRTKLSFWYSLTLAASIAAFAWVTYDILENKLIGDIDTQLEQDAQRLYQTLDEGIIAIADMERLNLIDHFDITQLNWNIFSSSHWVSSGFSARSYDAGRYNLKVSDRIYRIATIDFPDDIRIIVTKDISQTQSGLDELIWTLGFGFIIAVIAAVTGGYLLTGQTLKPLKELTEQLRYVSASHLDRRLVVSNPSDELGQLTTELNLVLERIEQSFQRLQSFTSDASHELRTPIAVIRSIGELGLEQSKTQDASKESISSMLETLYQLESIVDGLLTLTRADAGTLAKMKQQTNIAYELHKITDSLAILATEKKHQMSCYANSPCLLEVHIDSVKVALMNLIANAIQYTPQKGVININLDNNHNNEVQISIQDNGITIPVAHREKIFERFHRIEKDRSRHSGGIGLGLAIAKSAIEANGGSIKYEAVEPKGNRFVITF